MNQIRIPELAIEPCDDGSLLLAQDAGGQVDRVQVHPLHIRLIAERFGLAPTGDPRAARQISTLQRRLRLVREEVALLDEWLHAESSADRIALEEMVKARDILTMLNEFIADFELDAVRAASRPLGSSAKTPQDAKTADAETEPQQLNLA